MTQLDPRISEFESTEAAEAAEAYDRWFRSKVEAALADTRPTIPHDQVLAKMDAVIAAAQRPRV
jgi:hypothetical protein